MAVGFHRPPRIANSAPARCCCPQSCIEAPAQPAVNKLPEGASESPKLRFRGGADEAALINQATLGTLALTGLYCVLHGHLSGMTSLEATWSTLLHLPADWLEWYDAQALAQPVLTKACTSGICYYAGDVIAQLSAGASMSSIDLKRTSRSSAAGFVGHGPVAHYWLQWMDMHLSFSGAWWATVIKIATDQGFMSIVYNTVYTVLIGVFGLREPRSVFIDVRDTWWPAMRASWTFWPLVHLVTFSPLVPLELKVLWIDAMEILWVAIISRVNARENDGQMPPTTATV